MTREIKFRGRNAKGEWLVGDLIHNRGETFIAPEGIASPFATAEDFRVDPETVGQFTGLLDKNGKEIYEEDVVRAEWTDDEIAMFGNRVASPFNARVAWDDEATGFRLKELPTYDDWMLGFIHEVMGNIHDQPVLLNKE